LLPMSLTLAPPGRSARLAHEEERGGGLVKMKGKDNRVYPYRGTQATTVQQEGCFEHGNGEIAASACGLSWASRADLAMTATPFLSRRESPHTTAPTFSGLTGESSVFRGIVHSWMFRSSRSMTAIAEAFLNRIEQAGIQQRLDYERKFTTWQQYF
jgi:hypothetical protein